MSNVYIEPYHSARREIERLEVINAELLAALKHAVNAEDFVDNPWLTQARAAIAKAEGKS